MHITGPRLRAAHAKEEKNKMFPARPANSPAPTNTALLQGKKNRRTPNATVKWPTRFCAAKDRKHKTHNSTCHIQMQPVKIQMRPARRRSSATKPRQANRTSRRHLQVKDPEPRRHSAGNSNHRINTGSAYHNNTDIRARHRANLS